jgi:hypothetical protein
MHNNNTCAARQSPGPTARYVAYTYVYSIPIPRAIAHKTYTLQSPPFALACPILPPHAPHCLRLRPLLPPITRDPGSCLLLPYHLPPPAWVFELAPSFLPPFPRPPHCTPFPLSLARARAALHLLPAPVPPSCSCAKCSSAVYCAVAHCSINVLPTRVRVRSSL